MNKVFTVRIPSLIVSLLFVTSGLWANDDKTKDKDPAASPKIQVENTSTLSNEMQSKLTSAISQLERQLIANESMLSNLSDKMTDLKENLTVQEMSDRNKASQLMTYLDQNPSKVMSAASLKFEDITNCPLGVSFVTKSNAQILLGILEAKITPSEPGHAKLLVFMRIKFTIEGQERDLFFGVDNLKFTKKGFVAGSGFKAVLLGDFIITSKKWSLILKGGSGVGDRTYDVSRTYIDFDCNNFNQASIAAELVFPRSVLLPYNPNTGKAEPNGRVTFGFNASFTKDQGASGLLVNLTTASGKSANQGAFCVPSFERFGFRINNATYDANDFQNAAGMVFPAKYEGDKSAAWTGFYLQSFDVYLPKAFRKPANDTEVGGNYESTKLTTIQSVGGKSIIIDRTGFTGTVYYNSANPIELRAQKWEYNLASLELNFIQNQFESGVFGGKVTTPIQDKLDSDVDSGSLVYTGKISMEGKYELNIAVENDISLTIKAFRAKGIISAGSWVKFEYVVDDVNGDKFYPSGSLNGEFTPATKVKGGKTAIESQAIGHDDATARFVGLRFVNLNFQTKDPSAPYVSIDDFEYQKGGNAESSQSRFGNYPVSITRLAKFTGSLDGSTPAQNDLWIDFGFNVSLVKDKFGGDAAMIIKTKYDNTTGKLKFDDIALQSIYIHGSTTAFDLDGNVDFYDCEDKKGFQGMMNLKLTYPFKVDICASANFGYQKPNSETPVGFRYGYVDAFLGSEDLGIPTGIGDLMINGAGMGIYFNMKPAFTSQTTETFCGLPAVNCSNTKLMTYEANSGIPFGFKVMLGIKTGSESFHGRVSLDFALDRQYGINSVALYGSGAFTSKLLNSVVTELESFKVGMNAMVATATDEELSNFSSGNFSQVDLKAKADVFNKARNDKYADLGRKNPDDPSKPYTTKQDGDIAFDIGFMLNVPEKTLHAEAAVFINKGNLRGIGKNGLVGRAVLHIGKDNLFNTDKTVFYIHAGYPSPLTSRMGILYSLGGSNNIGITAYAMIGWGVPEFPNPPQRVIEYLGLPASYFRKTSGEMETIKQGYAIALGASAFFTFDKDLTKNWSVEAQADIGLDFLMSNNDSCKPDGGWLARGQVYGYASAKLLRKGKNKGGASFGFLFRGNGLRPLGALGTVCLEPPIIGFLTGKVCIGVEVGNVCKP